MKIFLHEENILIKVVFAIFSLFSCNVLCSENFEFEDERMNYENSKTDFYDEISNEIKKQIGSFVKINFTEKSMQKLFSMQQLIKESGTKIFKIFSVETYRRYFKTQIYLNGRKYVLYGYFSELIKVPVLKNSDQCRKITENDIGYVFITTDEDRNFVKTERELIGKKVRDVVPYAPIPKKNVYDNFDVKKNSDVTIILNYKNLTLKTPGKVMSNGSIDDIVPVMNLKSKKIIDCRVINQTTVTPVGF